METHEDGRPSALHLPNGRFAVDEVLEVWRIDDEWWRQRPVSRVYYSLLLGDGRTATVYQDLISGRWAGQSY